MTDYIKSMRKYISHERLMIVGGSVIVHKNGKILLQLRKDNGCWGYPGGCVELGESVEETAKRELFEETGLVANSLELLGIFSGAELFYTYPNGDMVANNDVVYLCEDFSGEIITETNETTDLRWFEMDGLPENISPPVKKPLAQCIETLKARATIPRLQGRAVFEENDQAKSVTTRIFAGAFLSCGNKILMLERGLHKELGAGMWAGIGGHLDIQDIKNPRAINLAETCYREVLEEAGIPKSHINGLKLRYISVHKRNSQIHWIYHFFGELGEEICPTETDEGKFHWVDKTDIPGLPMSVVVKQAIIHRLKNPNDDGLHLIAISPDGNAVISPL